MVMREAVINKSGAAARQRSDTCSLAAPGESSDGGATGSAASYDGDGFSFGPAGASGYVFATR